MNLEEILKDEKIQKIRSINSQYRRAYFQPMFPLFSEPVDLTPKYEKNPKVGVVIGTYGSVPYLDLQLHYLKKVNGIEKVLIHDDCSPQKEEILKLCKEYGADFFSTDRNMWHMRAIGSLGDEHCFYVGLIWAQKSGLDLLVKISRRLVPCYRWVDDFRKLAVSTDGLTFSSYCEKDKFPIRTECIGMNVKAWSHSDVLGTMHAYIKNEFPIFAEFWYNEIAREIGHFNRSGKYRKAMQKSLYRESGYVLWKDILGINRYTNEERHSDILWHQNCSVEDYFKKAEEIFPGKYKLEDFKDVTEI